MKLGDATEYIRIKAILNNAKNYNIIIPIIIAALSIFAVLADPHNIKPLIFLAIGSVWALIGYSYYQHLKKEHEWVLEIDRKAALNKMEKEKQQKQSK